MRESIENWAPPALLKALRRLRGGQGGITFRGDYASWGDAARDSTGYGSDEILRRIREAAVQVKEGKARFERDGVCFHHEEYRWEVVACLMMAAASCGGRLNVLDFGGALGGFYFQHRALFAELPNLSWAVVEQPAYVDVGRREFEDDRLRFHSSIDACARAMPVDAVLFSSVLQYLEDPSRIVAQSRSAGARHIIVDRTPYRQGAEDMIVVQTVPESIFPGSMPMRIFSERGFASMMERHGYSRLAAFACPERDADGVSFRGAIYRSGGEGPRSRQTP